MLAQHVGLDGYEGVALYSPDLLISEPPALVRVHSSCLFSESFHADGCDCAAQLDAALDMIAGRGGLLVYCYEEGRGAGLAMKMRAIALELDRGMTTVEAFAELGLEVDPRSGSLASSVIQHLLGDAPVRLLTNNPTRVARLLQEGVNIVDREALVVEVNPQVGAYLRSKAIHLGHIVDGASAAE